MTDEAAEAAETAETAEAAEARASAARVEQVMKVRARVAEALPEFYGLRTEQAVELARRRNVELRVINLDAIEWHTSDQVHNRVTVEVQNGVVTSARNV